jgi:hypothetical protein
MSELDRLEILLNGSDDNISNALKLMISLINRRFDCLEVQHRKVEKDIKIVNDKIDNFKRELVAVRFFSTHPKMLLTILIAIILVMGSGLPSIFSFFAKLL